MTSPRILAFSGSGRRDSFNQRLVSCAAEGARAAGVETTVINLGDFDLPIFDQDVESDGTPEAAVRLKKLFLEHQGLLIASPEYNSSITPLLKNAIDWVSRPAEGEGPLAAYQGKTAAVLAGSPGGLGGIRGLVHLRSILGNIGVLVLPHQVAVPKVHEVLDGDEVTDQRTRSKLHDLGEQLAQLTLKEHA